MTDTNNIKQTGYESFTPNFNKTKFFEYCIGLSSGNETVKSYDKYILLYKKFDDTFNTKSHVTFKIKNFDVNLQYQKGDYEVNFSTNQNNISENNLYKEYNLFVKHYHNYSQIHYITFGHKFPTIRDINKNVWFDLEYLNELLGYSKRRYLATYYHDHYKILIKNEKYTDTEGLKIILNHSRKPGAKKVLDDLGLCMEYKKICLEADVLSEIIEFLGENIGYKLQYKLDSYYIDMYIPKYNIAIEVDEMGHSDRDPNKEHIREQYIKDNLTEKILRINPNAPNYRGVKELRKLSNLMK